ncbi:hypothetical protein IH879_08135 [candidate division KSB1 bacterium]|nr:hypothetical protein [candidate division KSB1 bacterium]
MRSKRLRKRESSIIKAKEVEKKRISWGKYVYLAVLLLMGIAAVRWTYERVFFMKGTGFLKAETTFVEARTIGRIQEIKCSINDRVSEGQPLVQFGNVVFANQLEIELSGGDYSTARKIIDLTGKIGATIDVILAGQDEADYAGSTLEMLDVDGGGDRRDQVAQVRRAAYFVEPFVELPTRVISRSRAPERFCCPDRLAWAS